MHASNDWSVSAFSSKTGTGHEFCAATMRSSSQYAPFDQPDDKGVPRRIARSLQPGHVIPRVTQIGLHDDADVRVIAEFGFEHRVLERPVDQVLIAVLLHVKVDEGACLRCQTEQRTTDGSARPRSHSQAPQAQGARKAPRA